ncbi:MAG: hypothetical protein Q8896_06630 [Bacteroidota bacterium]|nr:hypothetical protein [Bacteroidota bacterium]MDP4235219.1 hypothetical protein [Bacteroidota bacterium]
MATHLFDVASTDQHTVKPWFTGRVDFSPVVKDLSDRGFQLLGGRLDYIAGRPAAALVYQYRKHTINVFEWNTGVVNPQGEEKSTMKGFNLVAEWIGPIKVWIVSDLNTEELDILANALR